MELSFRPLGDDGPDLLAAVSAQRLGAQALYAVAAVSGLTDVDAITLSVTRLHGSGQVGGNVAVTAIAIAVVANLAFKAGVARIAGTAALGRACAVGFASMAVAIGIAVMLMRQAA